MSTFTWQGTNEVMRSLFRYGCLEQLVSENGTQFVKMNGIKHIHSAPHPASIGLTVWFVQTFKCAIKVSEVEGKTLNYRLSQFLFSYRASP